MLERFSLPVVATLAICATVFLVSSCGDETTIVSELDLGVVDGYTEAEIVAKLDAYCSTRECDGEIPIPAAPGGKDIGEYDDDLESLLYLLYGILPLPIETDVLLELASYFYPPVISDDFALVGPFRATINLDEACAPGTGSVEAVFTLAVRPTDEAENAGRQGALTDLVIVIWQTAYLVKLAECQFFGMTMQAKPPAARADIGTVRAGIANMKPGPSFPPLAEQGSGADQGSVTVNKPQKEKTAGDEPYPVWGVDQRVTSDLQYLFDPANPLEPYIGSGGVCYGGASATAADCEGIFIPAADVASFLLPNAPLP